MNDYPMTIFRLAYRAGSFGPGLDAIAAFLASRRVTRCRNGVCGLDAE